MSRLGCPPRDIKRTLANRPGYVASLRPLRQDQEISRASDRLPLNRLSHELGEKHADCDHSLGRTVASHGGPDELDSGRSYGCGRLRHRSCHRWARPIAPSQAPNGNLATRVGCLRKPNHCLGTVRDAGEWPDVAERSMSQARWTRTTCSQTSHGRELRCLAPQSHRGASNHRNADMELHHEARDQHRRTFLASRVSSTLARQTLRRTRSRPVPILRQS